MSEANDDPSSTSEEPRALESAPEVPTAGDRESLDTDRVVDSSATQGLSLDELSDAFAEMLVEGQGAL